MAKQFFVVFALVLVLAALVSAHDYHFEVVKDKKTINFQCKETKDSASDKYVETLADVTGRAGVNVKLLGEEGSLLRCYHRWGYWGRK